MYIVLFSLTTTLALEPAAIRNETITETGQVVGFEWYPFSADNRSAASNFCRSRNSELPTTYELRYFYKSLAVGSSNPETFYLVNFLESTMDSPNEAIGERMCIVMKSTAGQPVRFFIQGNSIHKIRLHANNVLRTSKYGMT